MTPIYFDHKASHYIMQPCIATAYVCIHTQCYWREGQYGVIYLVGRDLNYSGAFSEINVLLLTSKKLQYLQNNYKTSHFLAIEYIDECEHGVFKS